MQKILVGAFCWVLLMGIHNNIHAQQRDTTLVNKTVGDSTVRKTTALKEVVVNGVKTNYIEYHLDKIVVRVDALISATGGTAIDVLNGSPGVLVDENGGVSLKGRDGAVVYINDRPVRLSGTDLLNYLKSLPASMIDKIELMSNPSAKYNADGTAIINIKTKKLANKGFNGNIAPSAGFGHYFRANNSVLLNYRTGKFNFFTNANAAITNQYFKSDRQRTYQYANATPYYTLLQNVQEISHSYDFNYQMGIDYDINKYTSMSVLVEGFVNPYHETGSYENRFLNPAAKQDSLITSNSYYRTLSTRNAINYNFHHAFDGGRREINVYLDYLSFAPHSHQTLQSNLYYPADTLVKQYTLLTDNNFRAGIYSAKADYSDTIFGSIKWEQGIQTLYSERNSISNYFTQEGGVQMPDPTQNNHFRYREAIQATYINLQQNFKKISLQAGLRLESTNGNALQYDMVTRPDTSFSLNYVNLFPTAYIMYKPDSAGRHVFTFSIGKRIERPDYYDLNPSAFYFDRNTVNVGNSLLRPAFTTNAELSYTHHNAFNASLSFSNTNGFITRAYKQVGDAFITIPANIDHYTEITASINWPITITRWWTLNIAHQLVNRRYRGRVFNDETYTNQSRTVFYLKTYSQFKFKKGWSADLTTTYRGKLLLWQATMQPVYQLHAGIQKKVNEQSTITLSGNDVFHTWILKRNMTIPNAQVYYRLIFDTQRFMVTYRYRFGSSVSNRERKTGIEVEAGRAH